MNALPRRVFALLALLLLAGAARAAVLGDYIYDEAGLYDPRAMLEANEKIEELRDKTQIGIWITTLKKLPDEVAKPLREARNTREKVAIFKYFVIDRATKADQHGVLILVSNDPSFKGVIVTTDGKLPEVRFSEQDCEEVRRILISRQAAAKPNQTLLEAVEKVRTIVLNRSAATSVSWPLIGSVILGLVGLWLLLGVIRSRLLAGRAESVDSRGRRNSQVAGLLGGMFGAVAGHWIYDSLFDNRKEHQPAVPTPAGQNPMDDPLELSEGDKTPEEKATP
jgi:hypothetical protein